MPACKRLHTANLLGNSNNIAYEVDSKPPSLWENIFKWIFLYIYIYIYNRVIAKLTCMITKRMLTHVTCRKNTFDFKYALFQIIWRTLSSKVWYQVKVKSWLLMNYKSFVFTEFWSWSTLFLFYFFLIIKQNISYSIIQSGMRINAWVI